MKPFINLRSVLFTLSALALLGILQFSSQAGRPSSPPAQPTIILSGAIQGQGRVAAIRIAFNDSFGAEAGSFIANPDFRTAVIIDGVNKDPRTLRFYYCDSPDHDGTLDLVCNAPNHSAYYYKCLRIKGGIQQPKSNRIIFPKDSPWDISWKEIMDDVATGNLQSEVAYDVVK
jgi:hypothetical protein